MERRGGNCCGQAKEQEWDELCTVSLRSNSWEELTLSNSRIRPGRTHISRTTVDPMHGGKSPYFVKEGMDMMMCNLQKQMSNNPRFSCADS